MYKKFLSFASIISFGIATLFSPLAFADEVNTGVVDDYDSETSSDSEAGIMPISETDDSSTSTYRPGEITELTPGNCVLEGDVSTPCPSECYDETGTFQACVFDSETETYRTILEEGTSGEAEVVCADRNEPGCSESEDLAVEEADLAESEQPVEPATWPMVVSLVAIGITILSIIIFNLIGRKKK